jgi:hypothetical protein
MTTLHYPVRACGTLDHTVTVETYDLAIDTASFIASDLARTYRKTFIVASSVPDNVDVYVLAYGDPKLQDRQASLLPVIQYYADGTAVPLMRSVN